MTEDAALQEAYRAFKEENARSMKKLTTLTKALEAIIGASVYGERIERLPEAHKALVKCEDVARAAVAIAKDEPNADIMVIRANRHWQVPLFATETGKSH